MKPTQTLGLILWRTGILIVAGYFVFLALRLILHIADPVLEIGVSLVLAGALFVLISVVREQIEDARRERSYETRNESVHRMKREAAALGADAVVNLRFTTSQVMAGAAELLAYGTAVKIE